MGGAIGAKSEVGKGSTFWFEITLPELNNKYIEPSLVPEYIKHKRFLIVDDYDVNQEILENYLDDWKVSHRSVSSGKEALEELEKPFDNIPYDVVLIDYSMPIMNGIDLASHIRKNSDFESIILILITAIGKVEYIGDIEQLGFDGCIMKPFYERTFFDNLLNILSKNNNSTMNFELNKKVAKISTNNFNATILIVEDSVPNQEVATAMLEKMGCTFGVANDGEDAIEILENSPKKYDLIFMDCQMPGMDGLEATKIIRNFSWGKDLIIVAMTANALQGDKEVCLKAGMDNYISKPVKMSNLQQTLEMYLVDKKTS